MRRLIATCTCGEKVLYDYRHTGVIDMDEAFLAHQAAKRAEIA